MEEPFSSTFRLITCFSRFGVLMFPLSAHLDSIFSEFPGQRFFGLTTVSQDGRLAYLPGNNVLFAA
jgi:hypothetical protein